MKQGKIESLLQNQLSIPAALLEQYPVFGLDETEVMVLLQLHRFQQKRNNFPTPAELSASLTINESKCSEVLRKLIQKGFLAMMQLENDEHQLTEAYSLEPLWEKLIEDRPAEKTAQDEESFGTIFMLFEQEFGRPLSPFEIDMINTWIDLDKISSSLIKAALRESVLMGKLNFKYIDRILREWKQKGIQSVEQAREASKSFRSHKGSSSKSAANRDTSFYYNWLEEKGE